MTDFPPKGRYRHFKGNEYELLDFARHSETQEWMVVYRALYGDLARIVPVSPGWTLAFIVLGALMLGAAGIVAGIWAGRFDQMAALTNFVVVPLSFLSGTFYSVDHLSPLFRAISHLNPFFYIISGFRYGFIGVADSPVLAGGAILLLVNCGLGVFAYILLRTGWKLKA